jgi:fumarate reductase flavoprotein subunit
VDYHGVANIEHSLFDVVVIGSGGSGLFAAIAAAENRAKVMVLEKRSSPGGNTALAQAFFAAESPTQQRMGIDAPRDALFKMAMDYAHWRINPRIMRAFINRSGDTVGWLEERGLVIDRIPTYPPNINIRTFHFPKGGGAQVIEILVRECERLGVRLLVQTPAKKILIDASGKASGVIAVNNGKEFQINARAVVIATGGYGGNKELLEKHCPDYSENIRSMGIPHMGDGILMALEIGAASEGLGMLQLQGPVFEGARNGRSICMEPTTVWVNRKGERFTDEATGANHFECVNTMLQQPGRVSYTVFDETVKSGIIDRIKKGYITYRGLAYRSNRDVISDLSDDLELEAKKGRVNISNTWKQIAKWIEAPPSVLESTVDEYNRSCNRGHDALFNKDRRFLISLTKPPFYAVRCYPIFLTTIGGIKINHNMEVLDTNYDRIPGLYAVGNDAGGWEPNTYNAILSGHAFGFALNSGRIAGENASAHASEN